MPVKILLPEGRIVEGHPMKRNQRRDDNNKPIIDELTGQIKTQIYFGMAIPKRGETHWNQTKWGAQIYAEAQAAWPGGQTQRGDFAWKIVDGDSTDMNQNNVRWCDKEGYPGHWVVKISSSLPNGFACHHLGKYQPHECIRDENEIKCGDYGHPYIEVKSNNATGTKKPGIYINPELFALSRAGQLIVSGGPDASAVFAGLPGGAGAAPAPVPQAAPTPAPSAPPPPPAHDLVQPPAPEKYLVQGNEYTKEQLIGFGWTEAQIATAQRV